MENTNILAIVMRSLGYQLYTTGGRVSKTYDGPNATGEFTGWGHMILIVTIKGKKYMVDVGFGPNGPTRPVPLEENKPLTSFIPAHVKMIKDNIKPNVDQSQRLWIYQTQPNPESGWRDAFCFYEIEFLPQDYEIMNFWTSTHPKSFFTKKLFCTKFLLNKAEDDIIGTLSLMGIYLKRNINGNVEELASFNSEDERIYALGKWFNVHLEPMEVRGMRDSVLEI
ncbi:hypothetical protein PAAG_11532 [Paracoccidioides lutzii Pb01]|uniref:Uncharacterized protein n=1 Tax=Paracoccidioides lutzii (strain ATCC MYA-826 / Pb01) TaxID=502779 RepID=A0A0A2V5U9_PARBA|nr:hypothetical protein PAAG_11532 [Paracoccidioides lutzii Pb01]KGQ01687.1 hypothetical protein PAAG_11532 [Paracoccidioides lutzii Pb01]